MEGGWEIGGAVLHIEGGAGCEDGRVGVGRGIFCRRQLMRLISGEVPVLRGVAWQHLV